MISRYRVWNKIDKVMINKPNSPQLVDGVLTTDDDDVLMQYIGLKDKNGVDICDGDLFKHDQGFFLQVKYLAPAWRLFAVGGYGSESMEDMPCYKMKVVGNIYENQELLETKP